MAAWSQEKVLQPNWREVSAIIPKSKDLVSNGVALAFLWCPVQLKNIRSVLVGLFLMMPSWVHSNLFRLVLLCPPTFLNHSVH